MAHHQTPVRSPGESPSKARKAAVVRHRSTSRSTAIEPQKLTPATLLQLQRLAGNRATRSVLLRQTAEVSSAPQSVSIQRYVIEEAEENGRVYSVSGDRSMVVGMGTPNHELYVRDGDTVASMNEVMEHSPLETYVSGEIKLFDTDYLVVGLRFKIARRKDAVAVAALDDSPFLQKQLKKTKTGTTNLQEMYEDQVAPGIADYREGILGEKEKALALQAENFRVLAVEVQALLDDLNLFKKVSASELASVGNFDEVSEVADAVRGFIVIVDRLINSRAMTKTAVRDEKQALLECWFDEIDDEPRNLIDKLSQRILADIGRLHESFDGKNKVDMVTLQSYLFQQSNLASLSSEDSVMLYRACDVMSATLVGNKVTAKNQQNLKSYDAGDKSAFHYATKVLGSGADWVSLEGFAPSDLDREISGTKDQLFRNVDNTWQFMMQGSLAAAGELSGEDRYFELYTKLRYLLKGTRDEGQGKFSRFTRAKVDKKGSERSMGNAFTSDYMNPKAWEVFMRGSERQADADEVAGENAERYGLDPAAASQQNWDALIGTGRTKNSPRFG